MSVQIYLLYKLDSQTDLKCVINGEDGKTLEMENLDTVTREGLGPWGGTH